MIYAVEISFSDPVVEVEWNAWYTGHLHTLLTVPGIETAQRFRLEDGTGPGYIALYTVRSPKVYSSDAYRDIGGGGVASRQFSAYITRRRNLYDGMHHMPEVSADHRVVIADEEPRGLDLPDLALAELRVTALDGAPERRYLGVAPQAALHAWRKPASVRVYAPLAGRLASGRDTL